MYMKFKNYTTITELNISNAAKIYDVDERIIDVLIERGAVRDISKNGKPKYKWNTIPPTSVLIEDVYLELIGDAPLPTTKKDVNKQPKVMEISRKTPVTQEEIDYISKNMKKPVAKIARKFNRTKGSVHAIRRKVRNGTYAPTKSGELPVERERAENKEVTQDDIDYISTTMN